MVQDGLQKREGEGLHCVQSSTYLLLLFQNIEIFLVRALLHCSPFAYWDMNFLGVFRGKQLK